MTIIKLKSSDKKIFEVDEQFIRMSVTLKKKLRKLGITGNNNEPIPIKNITGATLSKVIEWVQQHKDDPPAVQDEDDELDELVERPDDIPAWDADFLKVNQNILLDLIMAASYLKIKGPLFEVAFKTLANLMRDKDPDEIHSHFKVENFSTSKEKKEIHRENE